MIHAKKYHPVYRKLFFIAWAILLAGCSSSAQQYKIDSTVSPTIDSIFKANILFNSPVTPRFSFHVKNTFDKERFKGGGMDLAYFLKDTDEEESYVSSFTVCYLNKDSIILAGGLFYVSGVGFKISIFKNSYDCIVDLESDENIYSKTNGKNSFIKSIQLKADSISMVLTQQPVFKKGSTVKGKITLTAESFYQLDNDHIPVQIHPSFDIIFNTTIEEKEKD